MGPLEAKGNLDIVGLKRCGNPVAQGEGEGEGEGAWRMAPMSQ